jgi:hypothetical protein
VLLPGVASSQVAARAGAVHGTVYDSVARRPVAMATVQVASAVNPGGTTYSATTDERGRFVILDLQPGRYIVGFHHIALDSLAVNSPVRSFDVEPDKRARIDLAVPSPATLMRAFCGADGQADSTGVVIGQLRDARTRLVLDSGHVQAAWHDIVLDSTGLRQEPAGLRSSVTREGWFVLCGVPGDGDVILRGWHGMDSTGFVLASVPTAEVRRRDLYVRGVANVAGVVVSDRRQPLANARIGVVGMKRSVSSDSAGAFYLGALPAGSQTLEVRALGYAPEHRLLHLRGDGDTTLAVTLTSMKKVLDTIQVVARRLYDRDLNGFQRRMRLGSGHHLDEEYIRRRRAFDVFQLLWSVPALRVVQTGFNKTVVIQRGASSCVPALYLNGMRMPNDLLGDLDLLARPDEVVALEVYRGLETPPEFLSFDGCGAIVVWTRSRPRTRP